MRNRSLRLCPLLKSHYCEKESPDSAPDPAIYSIPITVQAVHRASVRNQGNSPLHQRLSYHPRSVVPPVPGLRKFPHSAWRCHPGGSLRPDPFHNGKLFHLLRSEERRVGTAC